MRNDKNGCSTTANGCENYEFFKSGKKQYVQYDYRTDEGKLFSTVAADLETARARRDAWITNQKEEVQQ